MPYDYFHLAALARETESRLRGGRIDKIIMPDPLNVVLHVRSGGADYKLLLSSHRSFPAFYITREGFTGQQPPPAFCMHLRRYITGGVIESVIPAERERGVFIKIAARDELGAPKDFTLAYEIMGKYSNVILIGGDGTVSDCVHKIYPADNLRRNLFPGVEYSLPPAQSKTDILCAPEVSRVLGAFEGVNQRAFLAERLYGFAGITLDEIILAAFKKEKPSADFRAALDFFDANPGFPAKFVTSFNAAARELYDCPLTAPAVFTDGGKADFFMRRPETADCVTQTFATLSEAAEFIVAGKRRKADLDAKIKPALKAVKNALSRQENKLGALREKERECAGAERLKLFGETIYSNLYRIPKKARFFTADIYAESGVTETEIPLDPEKTAKENAAAYFKKYTKLKNAAAALVPQLESTETEIEYLNILADNLAVTETADEFKEIAPELASAGFIRPEANAKKRQVSAPYRFNIKGFEVLAGKNNLQNDEITKKAFDNDTFLHTRLIHGSHVIIHGKNPPQEVIAKAAALAAYFSRARRSENVPVDYTLKKYVKKPAHYKPGMVSYSRQKTLFVNPLNPADLDKT